MLRLELLRAVWKLTEVLGSDNVLQSGVSPTDGSFQATQHAFKAFVSHFGLPGTLFHSLNKSVAQ